MDPDSGDDLLHLVALRPHEIFEKEYDEIWGDQDLGIHLPGGEVCHEILRQKNDHQLKVFWSPETNESVTSPSIISDFHPPPSIQSKIKSLLLSLSFETSSVLVQFWAPITTVGGLSMLSALGQPFGVNENPNSFLGYRYSCIQLASSVEDISQLGPPGKVFIQGSSQECLNIARYSMEQFPLKNQAQSCGVGGYWALPLFERDDCHLPQICVGVLEILSFDGCYSSSGLQTIAENKDFVCNRSHCDECKQFHQKLLLPQKSALNLVEALMAPDTINVWVPCICDCRPGVFPEYDEDSGQTTLSNSSTMITQLFTQWPYFYWETELEMEYKMLGSQFPQTFTVRKGKSLIGRAYSRNKPCFFRDTSQCDYPYVYSEARPRFAIPLKFIDPNLPPLVWEVYIQRGRNISDYKDIENLLKLFLSNFAALLSKYDGSYELKEIQELFVEFSHSNDDDYVYFDVRRQDETLNVSEALAFDNPCTQDQRVEMSIGVSACVVAQINLDKTINGQLRNLEYLVGERRQQPPSLDQLPSVGAIVHPIAKTSTGSVFLYGEKETSLTVIKPFYGRKLTDVARELGVSRSTFKRRCRVLGIRRWPGHKKTKVIVKPTRSLDVGSEVVNESERVNHSAIEKEVTRDNYMLTSEYSKSNEIGNSTSQARNMIVKATYKDDTVKFHLSNNSTYEELLEELNERFKLESRRMKVKYEDEDGRIMIACDKDLSFYMKELISGGLTKMNLMVLPITE